VGCVWDLSEKLILSGQSRGELRLGGVEGKGGNWRRRFEFELTGGNGTGQGGRVCLGLKSSHFGSL
jgi:hypothetical protein